MQPSVGDDEASKLRKDIPTSWFTKIGENRNLFVMAPMVGQSDLPFRRLVRKHGVGVVYSEMYLADRFGCEADYRMKAFGSGVRSDDHPLVVQFAANNPEHFVKAALEAQSMGADAVDLNLGCPQHRARENHYGSWMTNPEDWELCCAVLNAAASHPDLKVPVTVKIRLQPTVEATVEFAIMLARAGASLVTVHGRQRGSEDRRRDGAADLEAISEVVNALAPLKVPVVSNGNVRVGRDIVDNLATTGAAGVMVAEHLLKDPAIFEKALKHFHCNTTAVCTAAPSPPPLLLEEKSSVSPSHHTTTAAAVATAAAAADVAIEKGGENEVERKSLEVPNALEVVREYVALLLEANEGDEEEDGRLHKKANQKGDKLAPSSGSSSSSSGGVGDGSLELSSSRRLRLEDGATLGKNGQMVRAKTAKRVEGGGKTEAGGGGGGAVLMVDGSCCEDGDDEFERMSVWWTNAEVAKGHLKNMLGEKGQLVSRNTFKRAPTVKAVLDCVTKRFATTTSP